MISIDQTLLDRHARGDWQRSVNFELASLASLQGTAKRYQAKYRRSLEALKDRIEEDDQSYTLEGYGLDKGKRWIRFYVATRKPICVDDLRELGFTAYRERSYHMIEGIDYQLWITPDIPGHMSVREAVESTW